MIPKCSPSHSTAAPRVSPLMMEKISFPLLFFARPIQSGFFSSSSSFSICRRLPAEFRAVTTHRQCFTHDYSADFMLKAYKSQKNFSTSLLKTFHHTQRTSFTRFPHYRDAWCWCGTLMKHINSKRLWHRKNKIMKYSYTLSYQQQQQNVREQRASLKGMKKYLLWNDVLHTLNTSRGKLYGRNR